MTQPAAAPPFEALDACHRDIQTHLDGLQQLMAQLAQGSVTTSTGKTALDIVHFFSTVARQHHADEEEDLFPDMLKHSSAERVAQIRHLIEDHFWIEKYWNDLAPLLSALGEPGHTGQSAELLACARRFVELCSRHIAFEESMIYPQAKARATTP